MSGYEEKGPTISVILRDRWIRGKRSYQQPQSIQSTGRVKKKEAGYQTCCPASPGSPPPPPPVSIDGAENNDGIRTDRTRRGIVSSLETDHVNPVVRMPYPVSAVVCVVSYDVVVKGNIISL